MQRNLPTSMKLAALAALTFLFAAPHAGAATCERPKGNPYTCSFDWTAGDVPTYIGVKDPASAYYYKSSPFYIGPQYGGPIGCDRFSEYFYAHRTRLSQVSCGVGYYGKDPSDINAYVYVKIGTKPFPYPPPGAYQWDYLELGFATQAEIEVRGQQELANCNRVLAFVKAYEASCPR